MPHLRQSRGYSDVTAESLTEIVVKCIFQARRIPTIDAIHFPSEYSGHVGISFFMRVEDREYISASASLRSTRCRGEGPFQEALYRSILELATK